MLNGAGGFQASPQIRSRLSHTAESGSLTYGLSVRLRETVHWTVSPPHPASRRRSYLRLRGLWLPPARTSTALTVRPHGRTDSVIHAEMTCLRHLCITMSAGAKGTINWLSTSTPPLRRWGWAGRFPRHPPRLCINIREPREYPD